MNSITGTQKLFSITSLIFLFTWQVSAQTNCEIVSEDFNSYYECAREQLKNSQYNDQIQYEYAQEFFDFYLKNHELEIAQNALADALVIWLNIGETEKITNVYQIIDHDAPVWDKLLPIIVASENYKSNYYQDYIELMEKLAHVSINPDSKTIALFEMATHHRKNEEIDKEMEIYREITSLNADVYQRKLSTWRLHELEYLSIGQEAPLFNLQSIEGEEFSLEEKKGKIIALYFWSGACLTCANDVAELQTLEKENQETGFEVVWIFFQKDEEKFTQKLEELNMEPPQFWLDEGKDHEVGKLYNLDYAPRLILIDKDGKIVGKSISTWFLKEEIQALLKS